MKFSIEKREIDKILPIINKVLPKGKVLDILKSVLLEVENNTLSITASNADIQYRAFLDVYDSEDGKVLVNGNTFISILKNIPNTSIISFELDSSLKISSDETYYKIPVLNPEDYIEVEDLRDKVKLFKFSRRKLVKAFSKVEFCAGEDESRLFLSGILWDNKGNIANFVASDSYRLGLYTEVLDEELDEFQIIIPVDVYSILDEIEHENLDIGFNEDYLVIGFDKGFINARLISGPYPDYTAIFPEGIANELFVSKYELESKLKAMSPLSPETFGIKVDKGVWIFAISDEGEEFKSNLIGRYEGDNIEIYFHYKRFSEIIKEIDESEIFIHIYSENRPVLIKSNNENLKYLIMPVKL
ncbi:MAG: DNA polymerase III subunit beta [candidate division WOR-3 bacterium]